MTITTTGYQLEIQNTGESILTSPHPLAQATASALFDLRHIYDANVN